MIIEEQKRSELTSRKLNMIMDYILLEASAIKKERTTARSGEKKTDG